MDDDRAKFACPPGEVVDYIKSSGIFDEIRNELKRQLSVTGGESRIKTVVENIINETKSNTNAQSYIDPILSVPNTREITALFRRNVMQCPEVRDTMASEVRSILSQNAMGSNNNSEYIHKFIKSKIQNAVSEMLRKAKEKDTEKHENLKASSDMEVEEKPFIRKIEPERAAAKLQSDAAEGKSPGVPIKKIPKPALSKAYTKSLSMQLKLSQTENKHSPLKNESPKIHSTSRVEEETKSKNDLLNDADKELTALKQNNSEDQVKSEDVKSTSEPNIKTTSCVTPAENESGTAPGVSKNAQLSEEPKNTPVNEGVLLSRKKLEEELLGLDSDDSSSDGEEDASSNKEAKKSEQAKKRKRGRPAKNGGKPSEEMDREQEPDEEKQGQSTRTRKVRRSLKYSGDFVY